MAPYLLSKMVSSNLRVAEGGVGNVLDVYATILLHDGALRVADVTTR